MSTSFRRRDTFSDEHLVGTAAGVMRSRAVRRLPGISTMCAKSFVSGALHT